MPVLIHDEGSLRNRGFVTCTDSFIFIGLILKQDPLLVIGVVSA